MDRCRLVVRRQKTEANQGGVKSPDERKQRGGRKKKKKIKMGLEVCDAKRDEVSLND